VSRTHAAASLRHSSIQRVGVQLDGGLAYRLWRGLSVEVGYQYWWVKSGGGTSTARTLSGDVDRPLFENRTERHGPYVGLQWRF
jgi:opacity protein-like surface antigen